MIFLVLAYDEMFGIHGRLTEPLHFALQTTGPFRFAWTLAHGTAVVVGGCCFLPLRLDLAANERTRMALAGGIHVAGALGMEMVGGLVYELRGGGDGLYRLLVTFEESLEMAGQIWFMDVLLGLLAYRGAK